MIDGSVIAERFAALQRDRLEDCWRRDLLTSNEPRVMVALPSYSIERSVLEHYGARIGPLEFRYLYGILRARQPGARVVYLSSRPVPQDLLHGYLALAEPEEREIIEQQILLASPDDVSPTPLARKVLDHPEVLDQVRRFIGDDAALIEPWTVTEAEEELAVALDAPLHGTDSSLRSIATKSEGRKLFRRAGIPLPAGVEDVRTPAEVATAIEQLRAADPAMPGVVVKLDDSVAGDGNVVIRFADTPRPDIDALLPDWYVEVLEHGGVVEELVVGDDFRSPSAQVSLRPDGEVDLLSTHDQRLGGEHGQVFEGCAFPADAGYATDIAALATRVGEALVELGAIGRAGIDFAVVRRASGGWDAYGLEINLRKGGTTHPFGITRLLTGGVYDPAAACFVLPDGTTRCYGATDNLVDPAWRDRQPLEVRERLAAAGVAYDRAAKVGVIPHLLDCLAVDGRMGYTAIGRTRDEADDLETRVVEALTD